MNYYVASMHIKGWMHYVDSDDSSHAIHLEEDDAGQKLCVSRRITLATTCFYHNFLLQTQNRVVQVLKTTGMGLVYNPT